ncbi:DUF3761 domain-containing protein [Luteibacter sp. 9133]|uniref:DUF3761 domain-containing protein n=1 Tax=Luteibacter sp. 9133 TaxID=1500891 RepID=UPI0009DD8D24
MSYVVRGAGALLLCVSSLLQISGSDAQARARPPQRTNAASLASPLLLEQGTYVNSQGHTIHRPANTDNGQVPAGASAQSRDATFSFSASRRGTCSHHGGVAQWL